MRKARIALGLAPLLLVALAGCATPPLPAPESEADCLVVMRTRIDNKSQIKTVRNFYFQLSSGGNEKPMPTSSPSYVVFRIDGPGVRISNIHSNITEEGWTGSAREMPMNVALPYKAGYLLILPLEFVVTYTPHATRSGAFNTRYDWRRLDERFKSELREKLRAREGFEAWKLEE